MNKKLILTGVSIVVGSAMLITTAFASMTGSTGYDIYKEAVKNTVHAKSATAEIQLSIKDNGKILVEGASTMKKDENSRAMSSTATMKAQGKEVTMETYANEDNVVIKEASSDEYYLMKSGKEKFNRHGHDFSHEQDQEMSKAGETVIDALVGDLKNYVSASSNSDGSSAVTIKLEDNQIPAVVNALASLAVKSAGEEEKTGRHAHKAPFEKDFDFEHPKLVDDIKITKVDVKAKVSKDKVIESQILTTVLTGKDAEGNAHEIELTAAMSFKDINNTVADKVDLTGKRVKEIKKEEMEH